MEAWAVPALETLIPLFTLLLTNGILRPVHTYYYLVLDSTVDVPEKTGNSEEARNAIEGEKIGNDIGKERTLFAKSVSLDAPRVVTGLSDYRKAS